MIKTKIIATIGPTSDSYEMLEKLILQGLNVARLNMSHGEHEEHLNKIEKIRKINKKYNTSTAIMIDTKGPEIRIGDFKESKVLLIRGQKFTLTTKEILGDENIVYINHKKIVQDVKKGVKILLSDGLIALTVTKLGRDYVETIVENTGVIKSRRGVNIPEVLLTLPALTLEDKKDLAFSVKNDVEYVSLSFIRRANDILDVRKYLNDLGGKDIKIIAKIESKEGVNNFDEILDVADGIMIARGDMGVELDLEKVPVFQKQMIKKANKEGKLVITATQMLESMVVNPRPTRAEVSDVANAIYDSTSAIMLSGETASGKYPLECVKMMQRISQEVEKSIDYWGKFKLLNIDTPNKDIICKTNFMIEDQNEFRKKINLSVCSSANLTNAKAIVVISDKGKTPQVISSFRVGCPVFVFTANYKTYLQLSIEWGIHAIYIDNEYDFDKILKKGIDKLIDLNLVKKDDIVILAGGTSKDTNTKNYISAQTMGAVIRI